MLKNIGLFLYFYKNVVFWVVFNVKNNTYKVLINN